MIKLTGPATHLEGLTLFPDDGDERTWYFVAVIIGHASTAAIQHRVRHVTRAGTVIEGPWQPTDPVAIVVGVPADAAATAGT